MVQEVSRTPSPVTGDSDRETETDSVETPTFLDESENADPSAMYKYNDFSGMPEDKDAAAETVSPSSRGSLESSIRVQKFPVKLYAILAQKEFHEIITWMPHGRSWKVLKPNLFESMVMPLFFEYSNYHSFNRLVNAWSFRRISSGPDRGSYYHELFLRGKPHLQKFMRRLPKTHKKLPMKKEDEPDFYKMDSENPLPPLEEKTASSTAKTLTRGQERSGVPPVEALGVSPADALGVSQVEALTRTAAGFPPVFPDAALSGDRLQAARRAMGFNTGMINPSTLSQLIDFKPPTDIRDLLSGSHQVRSSQLYNLQRLRQLQQMQLLERQLTGQLPSLDDALARIPLRF